MNKKEKNSFKTVQEEWMGETSEKEKEEKVIVVREASCSFD